MKKDNPLFTLAKEASIYVAAFLLVFVFVLSSTNSDLEGEVEDLTATIEKMDRETDDLCAESYREGFSEGEAEANCGEDYPEVIHVSDVYTIEDMDLEDIVSYIDGYHEYSNYLWDLYIKGFQDGYYARGSGLNKEQHEWIYDLKRIDGSYLKYDLGFR